MKEFERPAPVEGREGYEKFPGIDRVVVKGSALYALETGKDMRLARDVDFFFVTERSSRSRDIEIQYFENLVDAEKQLSPDAYETICGFIKKHKIEDKAIQITHASSDDLYEMALFDDEPELILWDRYWEVQKKLVKPVTKEKKEKISSVVRTAGRFLSGRAESIRRQAEEAYQLERYQNGELIRGRMPGYLYPRTRDLATALRLADLGERFSVSVDDSELALQEANAKEKQLRIAVSGGDEAGDLKKEEGYPRRRRVWVADRFAGRGINSAFCNLAVKKDLFGFIEKRYPHLAEITRKIQEAGGVSEFIKNEYGEAYLARGHAILSDPKLTDVSLPLEAQKQLFSFWDGHSHLRDLFGEDIRLFFQHAGRIFKETVGETPESDASIKRRIIQSRISEIFASAETTRAEKRNAYEYLGEIALSHQSGGIELQGEYAAAKKFLQESLLKEQDKASRRVVADQFVKLGSSGNDSSIAYEFSAFIKQESAALKKERGSRKSILSPSGMALLHTLFRLRGEDAGRAVFELMANPEVDPRLKKACLKNLENNKGFFPYVDFINRDACLRSGQIRWEDYAALWRVEKIASTTVREKLRGVCYSEADKLRFDGKGVVETNQELAKGLPPEFFLTLRRIFGDDAKRIQQWEAAINAVKSGRLQEAFLYDISNMLGYDREIVDLITDKIIATKQPTKEHLLLANRLLKKIRFISILQENQNQLGADFPLLDMTALLKEAKAPSVLEAEIDTVIVRGLHALTGRGDLSTDKIQTLFRAWEDPEPVFIFAAELARSGMSYKEGPQYKALMLTGEMLAHMDPPDFIEWKQWRYSTKDPVVKEQLSGMTPEQIAAYAEDDFVDMGEVIVGMLPSDKPKRIQDTLRHMVCHDLAEEGGNEEGVRIFRLAREFVRNAGKPSDIAVAVAADIESLNSRITTIDRLLRLEEDAALLERLPGDLKKWQEAEAAKRVELQKLGLRGTETRGEIEVRIDEMRREGVSEKEFSRLAKLKPIELADKVTGFLGRYRLSPAASPEELSDVGKSIQDSLDTLLVSEELRVLREEFFGSQEGIKRNQWYGALKDLKAGRTFLQLAQLTPQAIAFNRITPGKKKETVSGALDDLKKHFAGSDAILGTLKKIEEVIKEEAHPIGKERLALIFTDNPMALLTVGTYPGSARSCQHYENGDYVLAAYVADAYTKNCLLVDLDKLPEEVNQELENAADTEERLKVFQSHTFAFIRAAVARRLTKIVHRKADGKPQIFLEPVYTPLDRESITRLMNAYAISSLEPKTGLKAVRGGGMNKLMMVRVAASRNNSQYEDGESGGPGGGGGGMGTMRGAYEMPAQPLRDVDYLVR
ncbi:MAG: hypothetical protein HYW90_03680 [Candidatus Sungbacteria bacterium]|nr:hypothetical protein [Candidatus Sungbacteria bacterium]